MIVLNSIVALLGCIVALTVGIEVLKLIIFFRWIFRLPTTHGFFYFVLGSIAICVIGELILVSILVYFDIIVLAPNELVDLPLSENSVKRFEADFYNTPETQEQAALAKKKNEEFKDWVILGILIFYGLGCYLACYR